MQEIVDCPSSTEVYGGRLTGEGLQRNCRLVGPALVGMYVICSAVRSCVLLSRLLGNSQAIDAKIVADARDNQECPASIHDRGEDEVESQVPQLEVC